jgi:hypothetical protein
VFGCGANVLQKIGFPLEREYGNATARRLTEIHVVESGGRRHNDFETASTTEHLGIDPVAQANPEDIDISGSRNETLTIEIFKYDFAGSAQLVHRA